MRPREFREGTASPRSKDDEVCAVALMSCPHMGSVRLERALGVFGGGPRGVLEALSDGAATALSAGRDRIPPSHAEEVSGYLRRYDFDSASRRLEGIGARVIFRGSAGYPPLLDASPTAPPFLLVAGAWPLPEAPLVAIVGTRRATATGIEVARRMARDIAASGLGVVSGLARGIDAAAHGGSLESSGQPSAGASIAVLGCGIDIAYPRQNAELYRRLLVSGTVVSQYGLGAPPEKWRFPERNRTIAGLSRAVVVVESYARGGALSTVAAANEMGREVLAVPGSILNPAAEGTNQLIWEGAAPARSAEDVLLYLSGEAGIRLPLSEPTTGADLDPGRHGTEPPSDLGGMSSLEQEILAILGDKEPRTISEISSCCGAPAVRVIDGLAALSRRGLVAPFGQERFVARDAVPAHSAHSYSYWR